MTYRLLLVAVGLLLGAAACDTGELSRASAAELENSVGAVRSAAESGDRATALSALAELRTLVREAQADGELSQARAAEILEEADDVETKLRALPEATVREEDAGEVEDPADGDGSDGGDGTGGGSDDT